MKGRNIHYQSFWTLTANRGALGSEQVKTLAEAKGLTPQQYMFAFMMSMENVTPLSGTTSRIHMAQDVAVMERVQSGESMFTTHEQRLFAKILGMPMDAPGSTAYN